MSLQIGFLQIGYYFFAKGKFKSCRLTNYKTIECSLKVLDGSCWVEPHYEWFFGIDLIIISRFAKKQFEILFITCSRKT
jgi:hypothetical protein